MLNDRRVLLTNELIVGWHAGALTIGFQGFQSWALTALKAQIRFDSALWCAVGAAEHGLPRRIVASHLHRLKSDALDDLERARNDLFAVSTQGQVLDVCVEDARWDALEHTGMRQHARRHGLVNTLAMLIADPGTSTRQLVMLSRKAASSRFNADELRHFELLAPHLAVAHATCRTLFLQASAAAERPSVEAGTAIVDGFGLVHDQSQNFLQMVRREWSDWPGTHLPAPILELLTRHAGTRWQFLGAQFVADIVPVDDLFLITARPRQTTDALTSRETAVAQRYAAGGSFREIAESLTLAPATVRSHLRNVYAKLQVRNKAQLARAMRSR